MPDPLLNLASGAMPIPTDNNELQGIIAACKRAHAPTMIHTLPELKKLLDIADQAYPAITEIAEAINQKPNYLNKQFFVDLLVWYHIAWMGSSIKKN